MNREKIIVLAAAALLIWVSWLVRYDVQLRSAQARPVVIVMLDRWTGSVYFSFNGEPWQEIKDK